MLDRFVYGTAEQLSPEAPVPVLKVARESVMLGGAGNVLRNLAALGVRCGLVGVIGDDAAGREVQALLGSCADCRLIVRPERPTTVKQRLIARRGEASGGARAGDQHLLRCDREALTALDPAAAEAVVEAARAAMTETSPGVLVLSDYGKGVIGRATAAASIRAARAVGWSVVADPKARDFSLYRGADLITPNRAELAAATGLPVGTDAEVAAAAHAVVASAGVGGVLATLGARGMMLVTSARDVLRLPAEARAVGDVSGAGDTVVAVLAAGLAGGLCPAVAARLAGIAAGIVVGKPGTAVPQVTEILRAIDGPAAANAGKVVGRLDARTRVRVWRRIGLRVGFTNGCFDLLHPGHVALLAKARRTCDRLVVGLNGDDSVRRLKGATRPIQAESARAAILAALTDVDLVVVFGEDTPLSLIEALRPDVLIKGADYGVDDMVGADLVRGYGGEAVLAELAPGFSTSETIRQLCEMSA